MIKSKFFMVLSLILSLSVLCCGIPAFAAYDPARDTGEYDESWIDESDTNHVDDFIVTRIDENGDYLYYGIDNTKENRHPLSHLRQERLDYTEFMKTYSSKSEELKKEAGSYLKQRSELLASVEKAYKAKDVKKEDISALTDRLSETDEKLLQTYEKFRSLFNTKQDYETCIQEIEDYLIKDKAETRPSKELRTKNYDAVISTVDEAVKNLKIESRELEKTFSADLKNSYYLEYAGKINTRIEQLSVLKGDLIMERNALSDNINRLKGEIDFAKNTASSYALKAQACLDESEKAGGRDSAGAGSAYYMQYEMYAKLVEKFDARVKTFSDLKASIEKTSIDYGYLYKNIPDTYLMSSIYAQGVVPHLSEASSFEDDLYRYDYYRDDFGDYKMIVSFRSR